jgi:hypothetical protein
MSETPEEVLYDPDDDDLQDDAPEGELKSAEVDGDNSFVEEEVQDPDGSDS